MKLVALISSVHWRLRSQLWLHVPCLWIARLRLWRMSEGSGAGVSPVPGTCPLSQGESSAFQLILFRRPCPPRTLKLAVKLPTSDLILDLPADSFTFLDRDNSIN